MVAFTALFFFKAGPQALEQGAAVACVGVQLAQRHESIEIFVFVSVWGPKNGAEVFELPVA